MNTADISFAALNQGAPIQRRSLSVKTIIGRQFKSFGHLSGKPHGFFGHTTYIDAGATQRFGFNNGAFFTMAGRSVGAGDTAAAATDPWADASAAPASTDSAASAASASADPWATAATPAPDASADPWGAASGGDTAKPKRTRKPRNAS